MAISSNTLTQLVQQSLNQSALPKETAQALKQLVMASLEQRLPIALSPAPRSSSGSRDATATAVQLQLSNGGAQPTSTNRVNVVLEQLPKAWQQLLAPLLQRRVSEAVLMPSNQRLSGSQLQHQLLPLQQNLELTVRIVPSNRVGEPAQIQLLNAKGDSQVWQNPPPALQKLLAPVFQQVSRSSAGAAPQPFSLQLQIMLSSDKPLPQTAMGSNKAPQLQLQWQLPAQTVNSADTRSHIAPQTVKVMLSTKVFENLPAPIKQQLLQTLVSDSKSPVKSEATAPTSPVSNTKPALFANRAAPPEFSGLRLRHSQQQPLQMTIKALTPLLEPQQPLRPLIINLLPLILRSSSWNQPANLQQWTNQWFAAKPVSFGENSPHQLGGIGTLLQLLLGAKTTPTARTENPLQQVFNQLQQQLGESGVQRLLQQLSGTLASAQLSQARLQDSAGNQPEYYLLLPAMNAKAERDTELLIRRDGGSGKDDDEQRNAWLFTLRFELAEMGPLLVKGRYQAQGTRIDFYASSALAQRKLEAQLTQFEQRLQALEVNSVALRVQQGQIPETLATQPSGIVRVTV